MDTSSELLELPHYIDSSMRATWHACRKKHEWSALRSLYPTGKSVHLIAGAAVAAGLEMARKHCFAPGRDPAGVTLDELLEHAYVGFLSEWGTYEPPEKSTKTIINTWAALVHYLTQFHPAADPIQPYIRPNGTPAIEYTFSIPIEEVLHPLTNDPFLFVGRFDMLGLYSGLPVVVDEKTTGQIGFDWASQWDLRGQFLGYCWACQQQGIPVSNAAIRGIGIYVTQDKVVTALTSYPQHLIDRWHRQLIIDLKQIVRSYLLALEGDNLDEIYQYNFADSCASYGGCAFATLCLDSKPERFFNNYVKHRWNPLAKQPVKELPNG